MLEGLPRVVPGEAISRITSPFGNTLRIDESCRFSVVHRRYTCQVQFWLALSSISHQDRSRVFSLGSRSSFHVSHPDVAEWVTKTGGVGIIEHISWLLDFLSAWAPAKRLPWTLRIWRDGCDSDLSRSMEREMTERPCRRGLRNDQTTEPSIDVTHDSLISRPREVLAIQ